MTAIVAADFTGDGSADIIARDGAGNLWLYPHTPSGFRAQSLIGSGWNGFSNLYAADYTGDGQADMVACDSAGNLWLYPHTPSGWGTSSRIYPGWSGCTALL
jgi:sugar lactone lactonase YvrE